MSAEDRDAERRRLVNEVQSARIRHHLARGYYAAGTITADELAAARERVDEAERALLEHRRGDDD